MRFIFKHFDKPIFRAYEKNDYFERAFKES